jgi:hypothetical protein
MGGRRWLDWADARDIVQYTIDGKPELSTRNLMSLGDEKKWKLYDGVYQIGRGLREKGYEWEEVREEIAKLVSRRPVKPLVDRILDKLEPVIGLPSRILGITDCPDEPSQC